MHGNLKLVSPLGRKKNTFMCTCSKVSVNRFITLYSCLFFFLFLDFRWTALDEDQCVNTMLRHCSLTRGLHSLMVGGVHRRVWSGSAPGPVTLKKAGSSSAVVDTVGDLISMCEQAPFDVNGSAVTDLTVRNTLRVAADRV
ncbi:Hypothetical protein, putative, partial [Bodo saltans]